MKYKAQSKKPWHCFGCLNSLFAIEIFQAIDCMLPKIWKIPQRQNLQYLIFLVLITSSIWYPIRWFSEHNCRSIWLDCFLAKHPQIRWDSPEKDSVHLLGREKARMLLPETEWRESWGSQQLECSHSFKPCVFSRVTLQVWLGSPNPEMRKGQLSSYTLCS